MNILKERRWVRFERMKNMNEFSKELDSIIKNRGISNTKAGKLSNIDPSLLRRYRLGERIPRNGQVLKKINEGLGLSITEQNDLAYAYKITKMPIDENEITMDRILSILDGDIEKAKSSFINIKEYICEDVDFSRFENQIMNGVSDIKQIQNVLSFIGKYAKENDEKIYVLSELLRKKEKLTPILRFDVPDIQETEQLIIINPLMDKYDLLISYIHHAGISNKTREHSFYVYKTNCTVDISDSWMYLSDQFVFKYEIYDNSVSGFLSFEANVVRYYKDLYDRYREQSSKKKGNIKDIFLDLLNKAR